jgi:hypothetical protein
VEQAKSTFLSEVHLPLSGGPQSAARIAGPIEAITRLVPTPHLSLKITISDR